MNNERYAGRQERAPEVGERLPRERLREIGRKVERVLRREEKFGEYKLSPEMSERVLNDTWTENDPLMDMDGRMRRWTVEDLRRAELEPRYGMELEGVRMGFSEMFQLNGNRDAVIGYVDVGKGQTIARSYYRSNSQGVWRYMPDRQQEADGHVSWYGKGQSEDAVTLPSEVQMFLNMMGEAQESQMGRREQKRAEALQGARTMAFFGMAKEARRGDYHKNRVEGRVNDSLAREVKAQPRFEFAGHNAPEHMRLFSDAEPDFRRQVSGYRMRTRKYGEVEAKTFLSEDGRLKWTMMEDARGVAWVGQVETRSPITSTGCRQEWVEAGDFATPAYEYPQQARGYGDRSDVLYDSRGQVQYVSMWRNYLSKIPMIQRYKAMTSRKSA